MINRTKNQNFCDLQTSTSRLSGLKMPLMLLIIILMSLGVFVMPVANCTEAEIRISLPGMNYEFIKKGGCHSTNQS